MVISTLHEEVLGPIDEPDEDFEEVDQQEQIPLDQEMVLMAFAKMRQFMEEKIAKVEENVRNDIEGKIDQALELMGRMTEEIRNLKESQSFQKNFQHKSFEDVQATSVRMGSLEKSLESHMKALRQEVLDTSAAHAKATERFLNKRLEGISGLQGDNLTAYQKGLELGISGAEERFKSLLSMLPVPQVHFAVPEGSFKFQQLPAQVDVHVPQQAAPMVENKFMVPEAGFKLFLEQPSPTIVVPDKSLHVEVHQAAAPPVVISEKAFEIKAPEVHINVPEQEAPHVTVNTPRRKSIKHITYDENGRPRDIVEEQVDEQ